MNGGFLGVALSVIALSMVAACGPSDGGAPSGSSGSPASGTSPCTAGFRQVPGDLLVDGDPVCVPEDPQRIAMLDTSSLGVMLTTGLESPVAYSGFNANLLADGGPELEVGSVLAEAENVDEAEGNPSLELLAATRPDLIFINDNGGSYGGDLDRYQAIAPTVMTVDQVDVRDSYLMVADVLDVADEAASQWEALDRRSDELGALLDERDLAPVELSILAIFGDLYIFDTEGLGAADVLEGTGIEIKPEEFGLDPISRERLDLVDNDELVVIVYPANADQFDDLTDDPLWDALDVVQRGDATDVGSHWFGGTPYEYHKILDDLFRLVADVDPETVSPNPLLPV